MSYITRSHAGCLYTKGIGIVQRAFTGVRLAENNDIKDINFYKTQMPENCSSNLPSWAVVKSLCSV
jgi:hypothetical protein